MKTVVVLGMHRSGTSSLAGALHNSGISMGVDLTGPWFANPKGGFEEKSIFGINGRIIGNAGGTWYDPPPIDALYKQGIRSKFEPMISDAIDALIQKLNNPPIWGFKDPHHCLTAHLWHPFLSNPHYLIISRNPFAVSRSLQTRNKFTLAKGLHIQARHLEAVSKFLQDTNPPQLWLSYESLLTSPEQICAAVSNFLGHPVDHSFIDISLDHHNKEYPCQVGPR